MPFRPTFDCLWCGTAWTVRGPDDLEGWAQLCPTCVGKAGDNGFLRFRLRDALAERGAATAVAEAAAAADSAATDPGEYDDWYLRRGRYSHGPVHDAAWNAELDAAGLWLDELPLRGSIVELAAGTGWWSPLLAGKGELSIYDAAESTLDRARERLVAHRLRAHLHVRDAWAEPDRQVDGLFAGFWLGHVAQSRLDAFVALARRWLVPGGTFAFVDSLPDPQSGAVDNPVFHTPDEVRAALLRAGFAQAEVTTSGRFFLLGRATA